MVVKFKTGFAFLIGVSLIFYAFAAFGAGQTLESLKTSSPIFLDASDQEPDLEKAKPITVQLSESRGTLVFRVEQQRIGQSTISTGFTH